MLVESSTQSQDLWEEISTLVDDQAQVYEPMLRAWAGELSLPSDVLVSPAAWEDTMMRPWMQRATRLRGGSEMGWSIFTHPTADVALLQDRQQALRTLPKQTKQVVASLQPYELDMLWLFSLPSLPDAPSLQLLFPQALFLRAINHSSTVLSMFHIYKGYLAPFLHFVGPMTTMFGPYVYMRKQLGVKMPLTSYLKMMYMMARTLAKPTGNPRTDSVKFGSMVMYIVLFVLGVVQSFELAKTVRFLRKSILARLRRVRVFVATATRLEDKIPSTCWDAFGMRRPDTEQPIRIPSGIRGIHALLTDTTLRDRVKDVLLRMYVLDACCTMRARGVCMAKHLEPTPDAPHPTLWGMGHPSLSSTQVRNPVCLRRSLIVTGPNAAGKTTYVRSLAANILLAQSFGVCFANKAILAPYHTFGSFMRVTDQLGTASLFEAEARRCADILCQAQEATTKGLRSIVFLDEPMHSTPPVEGAATSIATMEHLGRLPGTRVVTTTHYFAITHLPETHPDHFQNVSMEAIASPSAPKGFVFPFKVRNGPSYQCIALELLEGSRLPEPVIARAMEWKNKICEREVRNDR